MNNTLKYRPVMSDKCPIPSNQTKSINSDSHIFKNSEDLKLFKSSRPFQLLIDDKILEVPGYAQNIFSGFRLIFEDTILLLKTMNEKYVVVYKNQTQERSYELFSIQQEYLFDEIVDINCGGGGLSKVYAFCVKKHTNCHHYPCQKYIKKIFLHKIGWGFTSDVLNGLDPKTINIRQPEGEKNETFDISELFGPFPQWPGDSYDYRYSKNPWWVALCTDDKYRIVYNGSGNLIWVTTKDGSCVQTFKRFIPTSEPNYFYFLTTENEELLLRAYENYDSLKCSLEEARKGINNTRVDPYDDRDFSEWKSTFLFPGIKHNIWPEKDSDKITPGVFTQQIKLN